jgi:hypothetical protein
MLKMNVSKQYKKVQSLPVRNLCINSDKALSGSNVDWLTNNYTFNAKYIALRYINFVNNVYYINEYSQNLRINAVNYPLTYGSYSVNQLINHLNSVQGVVVFAYNSIENKITTTSVGAEVLAFNDANNNTILGYMLGFTDKTGGALTIGPGVDFAANQLNLNYTSYIDICSNKLTQFTGSSFGDCQGSVLYRVPIQNYAYGASVVIEMQTPKILAMNDIALGCLDFYIVDDRGRKYLLDSNCPVSLVFDIYL